MTQQTKACLHMLCGKMGAGKSALATQLAQAEATVRLSEDAWLSALFAEQMTTGADYLRFSARLRPIIQAHVVDLLQGGLSVVLDFPANNVAQRAWMREVIALSGADHQLHLLDLPDAICLERLKKRNAEGAHPFAPTEAQFREFSKHFAPPTEDEGFTIIRHES